MPMRRSLAAALFVVGVILVAVFAVDEVIPWIVDAVGVPEATSARMLLPLTVSTGFVGMGMILGGTVLFFTHTQALATFGPYQRALVRLAAEHGQHPAVAPGGLLAFRGQNDGVPFELSLDPRRGTMVVRVQEAGRLSLAFLRPEHAPPSGAELRVGEGTGWELRAELPALARRLMADNGLVALLNSFFSVEHAVGAVHDRGGLEVTLGLPHPTEVDRAGRVGIKLATFLAQLNGRSGLR